MSAAASICAGPSPRDSGPGDIAPGGRPAAGAGFGEEAGANQSVFPAAGTAPANRAPTDEEVCRYALRRIRFRVKRLARKLALNLQDREDVQQEFLVAVLEARRRFDPERSNWRTYVEAVLDKKYKRFVRRYAPPLGSKPAVPQLLGNIGADREHRLADPRAEKDLELVELRADVATVLAKMPKHLRRIAELLMNLRPHEVAAALGISRSTVTRAVPLIRAFFKKDGLDGNS